MEGRFWIGSGGRREGGEEGEWEEDSVRRTDDLVEIESYAMSSG